MPCSTPGWGNRVNVRVLIAAIGFPAAVLVAGPPARAQIPEAMRAASRLARGADSARIARGLTELSQTAEISGLSSSELMMRVRTHASQDVRYLSVVAKDFNLANIARTQPGTLPIAEKLMMANLSDELSATAGMLKSGQCIPATAAILGDLTADIDAACREIAEAPGYAVADQHVWDNWIVEADGVLHRYALTAPRNLPAEDRHANAMLRHAVSTDDGVTWRDLGPAIRPPGNRWPDHVIWTGSTVVRTTRKGRKEFLTFFTGRSKATGELQQIGLARSMDGHHFELIREPVISSAERFGYDSVSDSDGIISALRDPYVFENPATGVYEMLFSTKAWKDGKLQAVVGRAVARDTSLMSWELKPPLDVPASYLQMEVPVLVEHNGEQFLFFSTTSSSNPHKLEARAAFRGYRADSLDGTWRPIYGDTDVIMDSRIYAISIFENAEGTFEATGFYPRHMPHPHTATPMIDIHWDATNTPHFDFDPALPDGWTTTERPVLRNQP